MRTINVSLSSAGITKAIQELEEYKNSLQAKADRLAERLATLGATNASLGFTRAAYHGDNDVEITVENSGEGSYTVLASGEAVLFIEFGAGATYGYGHPRANDFGYGPGTYPSDKGHWNDPKGWWIPKAKGGGHTYGNAPEAPMYLSAEQMKEEILRIAKEVFAE